MKLQRLEKERSLQSLSKFFPNFPRGEQLERCENKIKIQKIEKFKN
jgi:hypothetical protein